MAGLVLVFYVDAFLVGAPIGRAVGFGVVGLVVLIGFLHHADHGDVGQVGTSTPLLGAAAALAVLAVSRVTGPSAPCGVGEGWAVDVIYLTKPAAACCVQIVLAVSRLWVAASCCVTQLQVC